MERSRFGRVLYAIGGNERATRLAGAPVERYKIAAYMISGLFASIGEFFCQPALDAAT